MHLSEFIKSNIEAILVEWEAFARSLSSGRNLDADQLRDHAREILETIAQDMISPQSEAQRESRSKGKGRLMEMSLEFAQKHASIRHEEGFDINQVVSEYRALRASVIRLWTLERKAADTQTLHELIRFNEEIDQALTYAIQEYAAVAARNQDASLKDLKESEERYRQVAESLAQAHRNKDEFLAILAHELRNPLAPVQTGIEVLRLTAGIPAAAESPLDMMERQMAHLVRLVDDLMDISRISRGKVELQLDDVDIGDVIRQSLEATASYLHAGKRKVSIELPEEPLVVRGDAVRLVQVLGNLLSNAGKYTAEDGRIWVSAQRDGQQVRIVVRDDGIGIAPEKVGSLFEMFKQLDTKRSAGLGIGLALSRKLVELHGGSVKGSSKGLRLGSEFVLYLPLLHGERQTIAPEKGSVSSRFDAQKVLVVDDNQDAAETLHMLLQLLGAESRLAHDGPSALAQLEEFHPNLVLLDIGLPGMDGYEVARRMREKPVGKDIKVIAVTGWGQDDDRQRSLMAGINDHLVKPISMGDIQRVIGS